MNKKLVLFGALCALPVLMVAPGHTTKELRAPFHGRNIAHRGLYSKDQKTPENSLAAFEKAVEAGYGIELDVALSRDGEVVVFHDDTLERICGVKAGIGEKTFAELRELSLCASEERIPLLSEVLALVDGRVPIVVELKNGKRNRELCRKTLALLNAYRGEVCIESFNPLIVTWFRFHAPNLLRGQLSQQFGEYTGSGLPKAEAFALSHTLLNFAARPQFIAYRIGKKPFSIKLSEFLGAIPVAWTSHDRRSESENDFVIFEHYLPKVRYKPEETFGKTKK